MKDEVTLAEEGTPLAVFQKERTDATSEMFDNVDDEGGIYPTSHLFARLDACVASLLRSQSVRVVEELKKRAHTDIHISANWGMESKHEVVHLSDAIAIIKGEDKE